MIQKEKVKLAFSALFRFKISFKRTYLGARTINKHRNKSNTNRYLDFKTKADKVIRSQAPNLSLKYRKAS